MRMQIEKFVERKREMTSHTGWFVDNRIDY